MIEEEQKNDLQEVKKELENIVDYLEKLWPFILDLALKTQLKNLGILMQNELPAQKVSSFKEIYLPQIETYLENRCQRMMNRIREGRQYFYPEDLPKLDGMELITFFELTLLERLYYLTQLDQSRHQTQCYFQMYQVIHKACEDYITYSERNSMTKDPRNIRSYSSDSNNNEGIIGKIASQLYDNMFVKHTPENRQKARELWNSIRNPEAKSENLETLLGKLGIFFSEGNLTDNYNHSFIAFVLEALKEKPVLRVEFVKIIRKQAINKDDEDEIKNGDIYADFIFDHSRDYHDSTSADERMYVMNALKTLGKPVGFDIIAYRVVV